MKIQDWAKKEVELRIGFENDGDDFNYGGECAKSALKAFEALCSDGHSGMSIQFTKAMLNRLIDGLPLTVIDDTPEVWNLVKSRSGKEVYQCNRMSSLFKYVEDGKVRYSDNDQYVCIDVDNGSRYTGGGAHKIIEALYPITLPYFPNGKRIELYTEDFLVDETNGDYDTKGYLYLIHPTNGRVEINRYFKESEDGFKEISLAEYLTRKSIKIK